MLHLWHILVKSASWLAIGHVIALDTHVPGNILVRTASKEPKRSISGHQLFVLWLLTVPLHSLGSCPGARMRRRHHLVRCRIIRISPPIKRRRVPVQKRLLRHRSMSRALRVRIRLRRSVEILVVGNCRSVVACVPRVSHRLLARYHHRSCLMMIGTIGASMRRQVIVMLTLRLSSVGWNISRVMPSPLRLTLGYDCLVWALGHVCRLLHEMRCGSYSLACGSWSSIFRSWHLIHCSLILA